MNTLAMKSPKRALAFLGVLVTLGGSTLAARPLLERENTQAHALVDEAQRALAKGDRGSATLALERARLVAPRAGFVRTAIDAARIHDGETVASRAFRLLTSEEWSWLGIGLGWLLGISLTLAVLRRRPIASASRLAAGSGFLLAMAGVVGSSETSAAVLTRDGPALIAPYANAAVVGPLPAGTVVERGAEHGTFVRVRSGDGQEGWIEQDRLQPIAGKGDPGLLLRSGSSTSRAIRADSTAA